MDGRSQRRGCGVGAAALLGALLLAVATVPAGDAARPSYAGATIENPQALPDFALRDQNGRVVRLEAARGKLVLLTFLYVECRDVCPLVAGNLNRALERLGTARKQVRVLAVSVDPAGDTRKAVRRFVRSHHLLPEFHYLIGSAAQLRPIWEAYGVASIRRAKGDVDHTLYTLLVDRGGKGRVLYDATALPGEVVHDLRLFLND
jgi:protein SCO1